MVCLMAGSRKIPPAAVASSACSQYIGERMKWSGPNAKICGRRTMKSIRLSLFILIAAAWVRPVGSADAVRVVPGGTVANPRQPQAAIDPQGDIYVAFGAGESIYCSKSTDKGLSYAAPVKVADVPKLALGMRRGPRIAAGKGFVAITAIGHEAGNLLAWRSTDGGKHWQGPIPVNDSSRDAREGLHAMAVGPDGQLYCVWLDCRDQERGKRIFGAGSSDGGKTWTENKEIYRSPSGSVCECCHPSATFDSQGGIYAMWRNSIAGNRDLYVAASRDGGQTFGRAVKLGTGSWELDA